MSPQRVRDRDGDIWEQGEDGSWRLVADWAQMSYRNAKALFEDFGPLTEVEG